MSKLLLSLGDLLTALNSVREDERPALAQAFGMSYTPLPKPEPKRKKAKKTKPPPAETEPIHPPTLPQPSAATSPVFWRVAEAHRPAPDRPAVPAWLATQPLPDAGFYLPAPQARPPVAAPLLARARFARFMREQLTVQRRSGKPDLQRITQVLANRRALRRVPQQVLQRWPALVRVLVDGASSLRPFQHDVAVLLGQMRRQLGPRLQVHAMEAEPLLGSGAEAAPLPADATPTLVFSDAGALGADAALAQRWVNAAGRLQCGGRAPVLLAPLAAASAAGLANRPHGFWFDGRGRLRRTTVPSATAMVQAANAQPTTAGAAARADTALAGTPDASQTLSDSARKLRATLWGNCYVTPALLRALRLLLQRQGEGGALGGGLADELAVWHDQSMVSNANACAVRPEYRSVVTDDFQQLPPAVQSQAVALHLDHLAHQSPLVRAEYVLHLGGVVPSDTAVAQRLGQERAAAEQLAAQAAAWLARGDASTVQQDLAAFLARLGSRSGELLAGSETLRAGWALAQQEALRAGDLDLPAGLDLQQVSWVLREDDDSPRTHQLRLQGGPGEDGRPSVQAVFEAAPPQPTGPQPAAVLLSHLPAVPYLTLAPDADRDSLRRLVTVLGWLLPLQQAGQLKSFKLNLSQAWARPFLSHLLKLMQQLPRDAERLALEWLGFCRAGRLQWVPEAPARGEAVRVLPDDLVHLLETCLPDDLALLVVSRLPGGKAGRQHLRQGAAAVLSATWPTQVVAGAYQFELEPFHRPPWAEEIKVEGALHVTARTAEGRWLRWMPRAPWKVVQSDGSVAYYTPPVGFWWDEEEAQDFLIRNDTQMTCPSWAARHGVDEFGYWAEFVIAPPVSQQRARLSSSAWESLLTTQRMRFIPPGSFWMGSPLAEQGRSDGEELRHITLTRGMWLADTACTQGLWRRVMFSLPERQPEYDDELPVVRLSHDDIHEEFLPALASLVPGLSAQLPTETQWEMAARAGTSTAYPWGDEPGHEHMHFHGSSKGMSAGSPVKVRRFNANAWGLWQMHGNVWEWCSNAVVGHLNSGSLNPLQQKGNELVLRGGGWFEDARTCRSAHRLRFQPDIPFARFGFRLARRLSESTPAAHGIHEMPAQLLKPGSKPTGALAARPGPNPVPTADSPRSNKARAPTPAVSRPSTSLRRPISKK